MFGLESEIYEWKYLSFTYEMVRVRDEDLCSYFHKIFETEVKHNIQCHFVFMSLRHTFLL
ncbi:hypothetical protein HanPI659440_Chr09g0349571 [Helianthus annuus]|nr:hypothetical protein HanPI659440_Chr09g0349571 [Helianthus annuus]